MTVTEGDLQRKVPWRLDRGRSAHEMGYLPGLDGLRAIAIIGVLLYHAGLNFLPGGFLGVDVFFVLSGFLITTLILQEFDRYGSVNFRRFYLGRARRLLPAVLLLLVVVGFGVLVAYPDALSAFRQDALATLFYANNWWYVVVDQSYFESMGRPPLLKHLWSLSVEEQFYLMWPLIVVLLVKRGSRRLVRWVALALAALSTTWMAFLSIRNGFPIDADPSRAYFGTDSHCMGLLVGAALATIWRPGRLPTHLPTVPRAIITSFGVAMLAVILAFYLFVGEFTPWLYRGGFLALAFFTAVLIAAATHPAAPLGRVLGVAPLRYLGRRSYGIYLWHWPIFMVTRPGIDVPWSEPVAFVVRIAATLAIAEISYRIVEMPIRRGALGRAWQSLRARSVGLPRRISLGFILAMGVALISSVSIALAMNPGYGRGEVAPDVAMAMGIADGGPLDVSIDDEPVDSLSVDSNPTPTSEETDLSIEEVRAANGSVSVIGDSVVLGAKKAIREAIPGVKIDASVSRMPGAFTGRVKKLNRRNKLANTVVLHPATNGVLTEEILRNTLDPLVNYESVILVNSSVPKPWEKPNNDLINAVALDYPNVTVADWHSLAEGQNSFFASDGVHLTAPGAEAFANLIKDTAGL